MDGGGATGLVIAVLVALALCVGLPVLFGVVVAHIVRAQRQVAKTAQAVKSGAVEDLLPWGPGSLSELTREWVGASTYTGGLVGKTDDASGQVPSVRSATGWLLAFTMSSRANDGLVQATTSAHRLELRVTATGCWVTLNGAPLGTWSLGSAELSTPEGTPIGSYRRDLGDEPFGQLSVRGRDVARLDPRVEIDTVRAARPTPLFTHFAPGLTPEDESWALAFAVLELAWFGPRRLHGRTRRNG